MWDALRGIRRIAATAAAAAPRESDRDALLKGAAHELARQDARLWGQRRNILDLAVSTSVDLVGARGQCLVGESRAEFT